MLCVSFGIMIAGPDTWMHMCSAGRYLVIQVWMLVIEIGFVSKWNYPLLLHDCI